MSAPQSLNTVFSQFLGFNFHERLPRVSQTTKKVAAVGLGALFLIKTIFASQRRHGEGFRDQVGRTLLRSKTIREKLEKEIDEQTADFSEKVLERWKEFGEPYREIPAEGIKFGKILSLIRSYADITRKRLENSHISGTIYGASLIPENSNSVDVQGRGAEIADAPDSFDSSSPSDNSEHRKPLSVHQSLIKTQKEQAEANSKAISKYDKILSSQDLELEEFIEALSCGINALNAEVAREASFWNSLHSDEFPIGSFLEFQVIQMMGDMFGANPDEIMGLVTSGGTMSILETMLMYKKRASDLGYIKPGEGVILGSELSHAAFNKAGIDFDLNFVEVASTEDGKIDLIDLGKKMKDHWGKVISIIVSTPNYSKGSIDPVKNVSDLIREIYKGEDNRPQIHVDACLGSFVINFLDEYESDFLDRKKFPAVGSVSCDPHKFGEAAKGVSVALAHRDLVEYSVRAVAGWSGGIYGTKGFAGSKTCLPSAFALVAALAIGKSGYINIARALRSKTLEIVGLLESRGLKILRSSDLTVVAFKLDKRQSGESFPSGSTYELASQMKERGVTLNMLKGDCVHECVTARYLSDPKATEKFLRALDAGMAEVEKLADAGMIKEKDAGGYFEIAQMQSPGMENGFIEFLRNWAFGNIASRQVIAKHFMSETNPFYKA